MLKPWKKLQLILCEKIENIYAGADPRGVIGAIAISRHKAIFAVHCFVTAVL